MDKQRYAQAVQDVLDQGVTPESMQRAYELYQERIAKLWEENGGNPPAEIPQIYFKVDGKWYNLMDYEDPHPVKIQGPYKAHKDSIYFQGKAGSMTPVILAHMKNPQAARDTPEGDWALSTKSKKSKIKNEEVEPTTQHPEVFSKPWADTMWGTQHPTMAMNFTTPLGERLDQNNYSLKQSNADRVRDNLYKVLYAFKVTEPERIQELGEFPFNRPMIHERKQKGNKFGQTLKGGHWQDKIRKEGKKAFHGSYDQVPPDKRTVEDMMNAPQNLDDEHVATEELMIFDKTLPIELLFIMVSEPGKPFNATQAKFLDEISTGEPIANQAITEIFGNEGTPVDLTIEGPLNVFEPSLIYNSERMTPEEYAKLKEEWFEGVPPEGREERMRQFKDHDMARFRVDPDFSKDEIERAYRKGWDEEGEPIIATNKSFYPDLPHGFRRKDANVRARRDQ